MIPNDHGDRPRTARPPRGLAIGSLLLLLLAGGCGDADRPADDDPGTSAATSGAAGDPGAPGAAGARPDAGGETLGPAPRPAADVQMDARARAVAIRYADAVDAAPNDLTARRDLARVLHANGLNAGAMTAWNHVLALAPDDPAAWYHRARLRRERGDMAGAMADIDTAAELAPDQAAVFARRGIWHLEAGRLEEAEQDLRRAGEIDPEHRPAMEAMARLLIETDRHALALRDILVPLRNSGRATPHTRFLTGQALRRMDRMEEARIELEAGAGTDISWFAADPWVDELQPYWVGDRADLAKAQALIEAGRPSEAITVLEPLVDDPGTDTAARVLLGDALRRAGDLPRATEVLSDGIDAQPDETSLILTLATARLTDGDADAAGRLAQRAIDVNPRLAVAHELLARARFETEQWPEAEAAARRAVELDPTLRAANLFLGLAIDRQPRRRAEGFEQLQVTRRRHPDWWEPYYYLAAVLGSEGRFDDALRFAARANQLSPGNPRVADLLRLIGEQRQAAGATQP